MPKPTKARSERVTLRMTLEAKRTLQEAAAVGNKSLSEFVLDSALSAAEEFLPDRRVFYLDQEDWDAFMAARDAPPKDNRRLRNLFARKPAWVNISRRSGSCAAKPIACCGPTNGGTFGS
jgi:uncharacterized protein (DUF1778 family)